MVRPSWTPPERRNTLGDFFKKVKPQILLAIITLGTISTISLCRDGDQYIAVVTGCTGGIIALGMKILDSE